MAPVPRQPTTNRTAMVPRVPEQNYDKEILDLKENWNGSITHIISKHFFNAVQFITSASEEEWGSNWQELLCNYCPRPLGANRDAIMEKFWGLHGKSIARNHLNRRRQNTTQMMKTRFKGKPAGDNATNT
jgi:hypothetical protein